MTDTATGPYDHSPRSVAPHVFRLLGPTEELPETPRRQDPPPDDDRTKTAYGKIPTATKTPEDGSS